jgi:hypothetical protein
MTFSLSGDLPVSADVQFWEGYGWSHNTTLSAVGLEKYSWRCCCTFATRLTDPQACWGRTNKQRTGYVYYTVMAPLGHSADWRSLCNITHASSILVADCWTRQQPVVVDQRLEENIYVSLNTNPSFASDQRENVWIKSSGYVRFEVSTAVTMKNGVFCDVTPCGSCRNLRFGGT